MFFMRREDTRHYRYFSSQDAAADRLVHREEVRRLGEERANPRLTDPDYLTLRQRRRIFERWLSAIGQVSRVLDVGGRVQPYRSLLAAPSLYVGIDPILEGLVSVVAVGESLPFTAGSFDLVFCTQVLSYVRDARAVIREIHRVLIPRGHLLLSVPAMVPHYHDERWRFLPDGIRVLLGDFGRVEIVPEGYSVAGVCHTINAALNLQDRHWRVAAVLRATVVPMLNSIGRGLYGFSN